jgi:hypothetical protein
MPKADWNALITRRADLTQGTIRFVQGNRTYRAALWSINREGGTLAITLRDCQCRPTTKTGASKAAWHTCDRNLLVIGSEALIFDMGDGKLILRDHNELYMLCPRKTS